MKYIVDCENNGRIHALTDTEFALEYSDEYQLLEVHGTEVWSVYLDGEKHELIGQHKTVQEAEQSLLLHKFAQAMILASTGSIPIPDNTLAEAVQSVCNLAELWSIETAIAAQSTPEIANALRAMAIEEGLLNELVLA